MQRKIFLFLFPLYDFAGCPYKGHAAMCGLMIPTATIHLAYCTAVFGAFPSTALWRLIV